MEHRRIDRCANVHQAQLVCPARPGADHGRVGDRWWRMAAGSESHRCLRRRPAVAGHSQHSRPGDLQHRDQPLHAVLRRTDLHREVPNDARPPFLGGCLPVVRLRERVSVPGGQRGHAGGDIDQGGQGPRSGRLLAHERAGLRDFPRGTGPVVVWWQDLSFVESRDDVQAGRRLRFPAVPGVRLFEDVDVERDFHGICQLRQGAGVESRRHQRQRQPRRRRGLGR